VEAATWKELAMEWSVPDRKAWHAEAAELRARMLRYEGDWDDFDFRVGKDMTGAKLVALLMYIRDEHSEGLPQKFGEKWKELRELTSTINMVGVYELRPDTIKLKMSLFGTLEGIRSVRLSPDADHVAFVVGAEDDGGTSLFVAPTDGSSAPRLVERQVGAFPDWSADGQYLAYARASMPHPLMDKDAMGLGAIAWRRVRTPDGTLLKEFSETEDLAGVLYYETMRVRCLRDGRILFLAQDVQLPCAAGDMPQHFTLFEVSPGQRPTVARAITRQADEEISDTMGFFEVSPDDKRIVLPGDKGEIVMYDLGTGKVTQVSTAKDFEEKVRMVPVWRSNRELCFVVPGDEPRRMEVVLWHKGTTRMISKDWPESAVLGFLFIPEVTPEAAEAAEEMLAPVETDAE
jgi:hypothetical protein